MAGFRAVLDACVLVPMVKADVLLEFAHQGAYLPLWSDKILDEVARAIPIASAQRVPLEAARRRVRHMDAIFDDANVENWEDLESQITGIPDPDDRHVIAAAIRGHASVIVTDNLKDFPDTELKKWGLHAVESDEFLMDLLDLNLRRGLGCLRAVSERRKNPPQDLHAILDSLDRAGAQGFAFTARRLLEITSEG